MVVISRDVLYQILSSEQFWKKPLDLETVEQISLAVQEHCTLKLLPNDLSLKNLRAELFRLKTKALRAKVKGGNQFRKFKDGLRFSKYSWDVIVDREETQLIVEKIKAENREQLEEMEKENQDLRKKLCKAATEFSEVQKSLKRKPFSECTPGYQSKLRKKDTEKCRTALSFLKESDVTPISITVLRNDKEEVLKLFDVESTENSEVNENADDINTLIYIMDTFNISYEAYHELSMMFKVLPRNYAISKVVAELNSRFNIEITPDGLGVQQSLKKCLEDVLSHITDREKNFAQDGHVRIKISGDGTNVGKRIHLVNVTFTIINENKSASAQGNYPLAIIRTKEKYSDLAIGLSDLRREVWELQESTLRVNKRNFNIEIMLGGDYKFLLVVCGIPSIACQYFCLYCRCSKTEKLDLSKEWSMDDTAKGARLEYRFDQEVQNVSKGKKKKSANSCFSVSNEPLFTTITPHRVVIDHLHMFLRISDKLFNLLVSDLRYLDNINANSTFSSLQENKDKLKNVLKLESVLQMLGIHFELGVNVDSKKLEYRELTGPEKLRLLEHFDAAEFFDDENKASQIQELWNGFREINRLIKSDTPNADDIESKAKLWCDLYVSCYQARDITPYVHMLRYHVSELIRKHGPIIRYSQQGLEKFNDVVTKQFFRGTSHKGTSALKQVLEKQNRLVLLSSKKRVKESRKCQKCTATDHNSATCSAT